MAKTIQIRNVPERVHRTLRTRAAEAGKSLSDYVLEELVVIAARPRMSDVLRRAGSRDWGVDTQTIVSVVREARDRQ